VTSTSTVRCGYEWPADCERVDETDRPITQWCCIRDTVDDADRCVWHVDPEETDGKTLEALREETVPDAIAAQISGVTEYLNGALLQDIELPEGADILANTPLRGANLTNANLKNADLTDAYLEKADLTNANLKNADLTDTYLKNADLTNANLEKANLTNATLSSADLTDTYLKNADLTDAYLEKADLTDAYLEKADLTDASLNSADLSDANLLLADLSSANLTDAYFKNTTLENADLTDAYLEKADLTNANLLLADLSSANLFYSDLTNTNLLMANLTDANLKNVALTGAYLEKADLTNTNLRGADLSHVALYQTTLEGVNIDEGTEAQPPSLWERRADSSAEAGLFGRWGIRRLRALHRSRSDPSELQKAERQYRRFERLYRESDLGQDPALEVQEKHARRKRALAAGELGLWLRRAFSRWVLGYGLMIRPVLGVMLAVIAVCTVLYPFIGIADTSVGTSTAETAVVTYETVPPSASMDTVRTLGQSLYFSTITFSTLGYANVAPVGWARAVATVESFVGALSMAYLVSVLSRRAIR